MSINNLFSANDFDLKCHTIEASAGEIIGGDLTVNGNLVVDGTSTLDGATTINNSLLLRRNQALVTLQSDPLQSSFLSMGHDTGNWFFSTFGADSHLQLRQGGVAANQKFEMLMGTGVLELNTGNVSLLSGNFVLNNNNIVSAGSGAISLTSGNISLTSGNVSLASGNIVLTNGSIALTNGAISFAGGSQLNVYAEQTPTISFSGIWASPESTQINIVRVGKMITMTVNEILQTATIASTITSSAPIPSEFFPAVTIGTVIEIYDNATDTQGYASLSASGLFTIASGFVNNYAGTGTSGFKAFSLSYCLP